METALLEGTLDVREYQVTEVVEIEEFEDEGYHYLFAIAPDKTLCLSGQYLPPYENLANFPSDKIRIFVNAEMNVCYGIQSIGDKIDIKECVSSPSDEAWQAGVIPEDLTVLERPLEMLVNDIKQYA